MPKALLPAVFNPRLSIVPGLLCVAVGILGLVVSLQCGSWCLSENLLGLAILLSNGMTFAGFIPKYFHWKFERPSYAIMLTAITVYLGYVVIVAGSSY